MRAGDRVDLMRRLAQGIAEADYGFAERDLILRQFGFPTDRDAAGNTTFAYVLAQLQDGTDEGLVDLDEYLFSGSSRNSLDPADLPWESGVFRLFISHTHTHARLAGEVRSLLAAWRVDAFVAHTTIEPSREWEQTIEAALATCDALAVLVTQDFIQSRWCDQEVGYCLARKIPIVPVKLGPNPHGFIAKYQAATTTHPERGTFVGDAIFRTLARHPAIKLAMAAPVVYRFAATRSFNGARANFALLRDVPAEAWTRELVELAERAVTENSQLANAGITEPEQQALPEAAAELLAPIRERLQMDVTPPVTPEDDDIPF